MARITLPKKYLNEIIDVINDAIILSDRSGKILLFNHTAEAFFGYAEEEVIGQNIGIVFLEDDQLSFLRSRASLSAVALMRVRPCSGGRTMAASLATWPPPSTGARMKNTT